MAQTTRSSSRSSSSRSSRTKRSTGRNGSSGNARSSSKRTGSNGSRSTTSRRGSSSASRPKSAATKARQAVQNGPIAKTGGKVAELASKAKGPLLAGGAALAGVAGGAALKSRSQNRRPINRLKSVSMPKLDLDAVMDAARTVRSIGEQVGDVADAADKTRKKHK
jgi:hypothetical protein